MISDYRILKNSSLQRMDSFSLVFIFLANFIDAVDDSDQFESDIGNVFDANANEKDGNSAVGAHVILIIIVAVLLVILVVNL